MIQLDALKKRPERQTNKQTDKQNHRNSHVGPVLTSLASAGQKFIDYSIFDATIHASAECICQIMNMVVKVIYFLQKITCFWLSLKLFAIWLCEYPTSSKYFWGAKLFLRTRFSSSTTICSSAWHQRLKTCFQKSGQSKAYRAMGRGWVLGKKHKLLRFSL